MTDFLPFLKEDYQKRVLSGSSSLTTSWSSLAEDSIPAGYVAIVTGLAATNTNAGEIDITINGKTASEYGSPYELSALPNNLEAIEPMIRVEGPAKIGVRAHLTSTSATVAWRVEYVIVKRELIE